jgi:hypothetical protein
VFFSFCFSTFPPVLRKTQFRASVELASPEKRRIGGLAVIYETDLIVSADPDAGD